MESLWRSREFTDDDLNSFRYRGSSPWKTLRTSTTLLNDANWLKTTETGANWTPWLDEAIPAIKTVDNTFALTISPRALPPLGERLEDQPFAIRYLSMTKDLLKAILEKMKLHRALIVLVKRGVPVISRIKCTIDGITNCLVYTLRVDHSLSHQTAMTITHVPKSSQKGSMTHAMILGYEEADSQSLVERLENCKENVFSPFTLIKAFLHVERVRRFEQIDKQITNFRTIMANYGKLPFGEESLDFSVGANVQDPKSLIPLYLDVCTHKNRLTAWRTQIAGFRSHCSDFKVKNGEQTDIDPKEYLQSLVDEYDGRINRCDLVLQGASLAFQMETAHLSRLDAISAMRDGKQMKAIALLTMVFLPGTFIATILAVPEFEALKTTTNVSPWAWYLVMFLPLTALVLAIYFLWTNFYISKEQQILQKAAKMV